MPAETANLHRRVITIFVSLFSLLLIAANLLLSTKLSNTGSRLKQLETKAADLRRGNQMLDQELVSQYSLTFIKDQAESLGFTLRPDRLILTSDAPVAQIIKGQ